MYGIIQGKISLVEYNGENGIDHSWGNNGQNFLELFRISEEPSKILFLNSRRGLRNTRTLESEKNTNALFSTNFYKKLQEKILNQVGKKTELTEGMCFGEIDLINRRKRSNTAYAVEDTDLWIIEKENFEMNLFKTISKAESERIVFIFNMIPVFNNLPKKKFDEFYQQAVDFQIYKDNEIIYEEGDKSEFIYLIYQGECCLKRDISTPYIFNINFEKEIDNDGK